MLVTMVTTHGWICRRKESSGQRVRETESATEAYPPNTKCGRGNPVISASGRENRDNAIAMCDSLPVVVRRYEYHGYRGISYQRHRVFWWRRKGSAIDCTRRILESIINYGMVCFVIGKSKLCETMRRRRRRWRRPWEESICLALGCAALCVNLLAGRSGVAVASWGIPMQWKRREDFVCVLGKRRRRWQRQHCV